MTLRNTEHMSKCAKCRYYCRSGATFLFSHIGLCGLVFGYTVMGAFTFELFEADNESLKRQHMTSETQKVIDSLWDLTEGSQVLNESKWSENATVILSGYEKKLVQAMRKEGFDGNFNKTASPQWSFSGALLYSIIVITTIGYGNIAPKTDTGKIVTILYAIIGIPLLLLCLSNIGDAMAHSFKFIYWKVCCYLCSSPKAHQHRRSRSQRPSCYASAEVRSGPFQGTSSGQYGPLDRNVYGGPSATSQYDRQRSYASMESAQHSLPRSQHNYFASEAGVSDAHKVPVISNRYVLNMADSQVTHLHRQNHFGRMNTVDSTTYNHPSSPLIRCPPSLPKIQDPLPIGDELDFDDSQSLSTDREDDDAEEASVPIMLCILIVVGYICGGAILFSYWEGWDYGDSCYFCFITLTTIGFGDMVPGTAVLSEDAHLALGLCSLYLLFGMALLAMSFNLVQEEVTKSVTSIGKRIGILSEDDDDDDI